MLDISNQVRIFDPNAFGWQVHLLGGGSTNNLVGIGVLSLGIVDIHLWDFDLTEPQNIPTQPAFRATSDIGRPKVEAFKDYAERQEYESNLVLHYEAVDSHSELEGVVICGVDSMASRKEIWQAVVRQRRKIPLFIDIRTGADSFEGHVLNPFMPAQRERYARTLYSDENVKPLPCGSRSFAGTSFSLTGYVIDCLTLFAQGEYPREFLRKFPRSEIRKRPLANQ